MKPTIPGLLLTLLTGACAMPSMKALPAHPESTSSTRIAPVTTPQNGNWASGSSQEPKLYARDGSLVGAQPAGTVAVTPNVGQSSSEDGSRWTLLEQYQSAIEEKEGLEIEVQGLTAALDDAEQNELAMATELEQLRQYAAQCEEKIKTLEAEGVELASRLTTAQIRRLQSEKLLLEAKLDWKRVQAVINQPGTSGSVTGSTPGPIEPGQSKAQGE
jgi:hypothetical protein